MRKMEEINKQIDKLYKSDAHNKEYLKQFFCKLGDNNFNSATEETFLYETLLPKIYKLFQDKLLRKDIFFLHLIASNQKDLLKKCIHFDKKIFRLYLNDAVSLYNHCIYTKRHWFVDILHSNDLPQNIYNKVQVIRLMQLINNADIEVGRIKTIFNKINNNSGICGDWEVFLQRLQRLVDIHDFCVEYSKSVNSNFFHFASQHSLLETLSEFIEFTTRSSDVNQGCLEWLRKENDSSAETFHCFLIIADIVALILNDSYLSNHVNSLATDTKEKLLNITNKSKQIELLENIFALIFMKSTHFEADEKDLFVCGEKEVRLLLFILKSVLDELKLKNSYGKNDSEYGRFVQLNKYVTDATWRLELIVNVKNPVKYEANLLKYLLAPPEALIQLCLKRGDFERAYQVIRIFNLKKSFIAKEIEYTEKLNDLKDNLQKIFKIKEIQKQSAQLPLQSSSICSTDISRTIDEFFNSNPIITNVDNESVLLNFSGNSEYRFLTHFNATNELFMNIFDLAVTQPRNCEDCEIILHHAYANNNLDNEIISNCSMFSKKVLELFNEVKQEDLAVSQILASKYELQSFDVGKYKKEIEFYNNLERMYDEFLDTFRLVEAGNLNNNHPAHKALLNINKLCSDFSNNHKYLSKLYNYLKAFAKVLYIEQNSSDIVSKGRHTSYFELLYRNRSEIMGILLFERHLDPSEFEKYFAKLRLDFLYHVIGNCFPTINLHINDNLSKDELYPENSLHIPSAGIISYIQKRNWLLAYVLNEMYHVEGVQIDISALRVQTLTNYVNLPKIEHLTVLFDNNRIIAALQNDINCQKAADYISSQIKTENQLTSSQSSGSSDSLETAEELCEDVLKSPNWKAFYDLLESVPEKQRENAVLLKTRDYVLQNLVRDGFEIEYYRYVQFISDAECRMQTIVEEMSKWPGEFCVDVIQCEISRFDIQPGQRMLSELKKWLNYVQLCLKLKSVLSENHWYKVHDKCITKPMDVILNILQHDDVDLLIEFIDLHQVDDELLLNINEDYFMHIFSIFHDLKSIKILLDKLPYRHSINICYTLLKTLKNLQHLNFITNYLINNVDDVKLKNVQISLEILSIFNATEQDQLLCLIEEPLNIIEILIMNTKLDKLALALSLIGNIDKSEVDNLLRKYATKSLDFRVITQPNPRLLRTPECKLMQSLDSLIGSEGRSFVMPEEVPKKEDWVLNDEVLECMCCQKVVFSMFNRRHHCRRCGRVVCYNCSTKRMLVESYGDVLVRVCQDCYSQTHDSSSVTSSSAAAGLLTDLNDSLSTKSIVYDYWILTDDAEHNEIVRDEFSYEHAPSVSLCLSIMKFHSKSTDYPKFLLDQCDVMLKLLQPSQEPIQEIDYLLVIKMLKSLAMAAKMNSIECGLHYGTSLADRILSQAELLGLLAERGCLNLLPVQNHSQEPYIDSAILRILRNKLLEREQWNLALEVSTKAGLDNTGVFAAWGKSSLKAGSLMSAREKFSRCFDRAGYYETQSEIEESTDRRCVSKTSNLSALSETKPTKNPPLLNEIIHILESNTNPIDIDVKQTEKLTASTLSLNQSVSLHFQVQDTAVSILNKLKSLKSIANGNYQIGEKLKRKPYAYKPTIDKMFYDECIYYLSRYGTHLSLLEFYVKHGEIDEALNYIIENQLSTDIFIDIYMRCLKDGMINQLQEHMSKMDSTLDIWKEYLRQICRHLEKQNMLHSLYQLQQFMTDYIRAAMTCIRFYQDNVKNFSDLLGRVNYLHMAEEHLKQVLEQDQWVEVASVSKLSSSSHESFEEKTLTNPSLVLKINSKDIDKHINTIWTQNEIAKFLAQCEDQGTQVIKLLESLINTKEREETLIPTLFGNTTDKMNLAVLAILSGPMVDDGFDMALRIIQEFKLKPVKVYCEAGKQLAKAERYDGIAQLVSCIKKSGTNDNVVTDMCDDMLTMAVATFTKANVTGTKVEDLIKLISDKATKISAYIEAKQLKTAYFLAVKYRRMSDIRRISREAELLNQPSIKALCQKMLQSHSHAPSQLKE